MKYNFRNIILFLSFIIICVILYHVFFPTIEETYINVNSKILPWRDNDFITRCTDLLNTCQTIDLNLNIKINDPPTKSDFINLLGQPSSRIPVLNINNDGVNYMPMIINYLYENNIDSITINVGNNNNSFNPIYKINGKTKDDLNNNINSAINKITSQVGTISSLYSQINNILQPEVNDLTRKNDLIQKNINTLQDYLNNWRFYNDWFSTQIKIGINKSQMKDNDKKITSDNTAIDSDRKMINDLTTMDSTIGEKINTIRQLVQIVTGLENINNITDISMTTRQTPLQNVKQNPTISDVLTNIRIYINMPSANMNNIDISSALLRISNILNNISIKMSPTAVADFKDLYKFYGLTYTYPSSEACMILRKNDNPTYLAKCPQ